MTSLPAARADELSELLFIRDDIFAADLAIVFGMSAWRRPLGRALELYRDGLAKKLVFTGGFNRRLQAVEAAEMARAAIAGGVPASDVLVEDKSTNTAENVANTLQHIDDAIGLGNIESVLLVAIHFHMQRVKMTAERAFPAGIRIGFASYPSAAYGEHDWHLSEIGRRDVLSEAEKIRKYLGEDI